MNPDDEIEAYINAQDFSVLMQYFVEAKTGKSLTDLFSEEECAQIKKIEELIAQQTQKPNRK